MPAPVWPVPGSNLQVAPQPRCGLPLWYPGVPHAGEGSRGHVPVASRCTQRRPGLLRPAVARDGGGDTLASDARGLCVSEGHGPGADGVRSARPHVAGKLRLWWSPSGARPLYMQVPSAQGFFHCRFFLWAPYKMWAYKLACPGCGRQLTGAGLYRTMRRVLDVSGWYYMGTEYLECAKKSTQRGPKTLCASWTWLTRLSFQQSSHTSKLQCYSLCLCVCACVCVTACVCVCVCVSQLTVVPSCLCRLSCDKRVVGLMKARTLGNSASALRAALVGQHTKDWLVRTLRYLSVLEQLQILYEMRIYNTTFP